MTGNIVLVNTTLSSHRTPVLPLPLLHASRLIADRYAVRIEVTDGKQLLPQDALRACEKAILVGFTALTGPCIADSLAIARQVRRSFPDVPLVWGGWHPTLMPSQTLACTLVDYVVRGQGEFTLSELADCLSSGQPVDDIAGLSYKRDGQICHNPDRPLAAVSSLPPIDLSLVPLEQYIYSGSSYLRMPGFGDRSIDYISSLGCPNNCVFCSTPTVYRRRWSGLSPTEILGELSVLVDRFGIDSVILRDDNVFTRKDRILSFCELLLQEDYNLRFGMVDATAKALLRFSHDELALLRRAGFVHLYIGAESGNDAILQAMRKPATVDEYVLAAERLEQHGMRAHFSFIVGTPLLNPSLSAEGIRKNIYENLDLIRRLYAVNPGSQFAQGFYTPYPGNDLYKQALASGFEEPSAFEEWAELSRERGFSSIPGHLTRLETTVSHVLATGFQPPSRIGSRLRWLVRMAMHFAAKWRFRLNLYCLPIEIVLYRAITAIAHQSSSSVAVPSDE